MPKKRPRDQASRTEGRSGSGDPPRLDEFRAQQLADDLLLSPTERVVAAERTARESEVLGTRRFLISFDRFEDYFEWKRLEEIRRLRRS